MTTHGFAINVDNDLAPFRWVVPCGLTGVQMTSVLEEIGPPGAGDLPLLTSVREGMAARFAEAFDRRAVGIELERVEAAAPAA